MYRSDGGMHTTRAHPSRAQRDTIPRVCARRQAWRPRHRGGSSRRSARRLAGRGGVTTETQGRWTASGGTRRARRPVAGRARARRSRRRRAQGERAWT
eukprot:2837839-Pleurochrysis_carterae.AAC.1